MVRILLSMVLVLNVFAAKAQHVRDMMPKPVNLEGWSISDSAKTYSGDDLFSLIDGGADLYLEYGFREVVSCRYENGDNSSLQVEIYHMGSDTAAYGIFSMMQSDKGTKVSFGNEARLFEYYMVFWKGEYFVTITGSDQKPATKNGMDKIATSIAGAIEHNGSIPEWTRLLPETGLADKKYFRGNIGLSNIYGFGGGDILNIQEGVYGKYDHSRLFIIPYKSEKSAKDHLNAAYQYLQKSSLFKNVTMSNDLVKCADSNGNALEVNVKGLYLYITLRR